MNFIHDMLKKASLDYPQKDAFICKDRKYTFKEIDEASSKVANFLLANGIKQGDRIGIFSVKSIEEIVAIFGIMKMGGIFVHINPHFKEDQLSHILLDCDIKVLFIHESKVKILNNINMDYDYFKLLISMSPNINIEKQDIVYKHDGILEKTDLSKEVCIEIKEDDPAAILYTSGSTGKPKGIIVTHKIFHDATVTSAQVLKNNADDRIISVTPFSFDGALSQLFTAIYVGATLVLQVSNFPKDIIDTMINEKITGFHGVPSFWKMLLQKHSPFAKYDYPNLRYVSIIGEVFPKEALASLRAILNKTEFYMMYGITEAFRSTCLLPEEFEIKIPSVGKPLPGVEICIVDDNGNPCKAGEVGEILHKGAFVSPGYWNNDIKTKEVFKDNVLYTGDLGRLDEEGYLYFVGRKDGMIKAMGYRISPEEIEDCLCKLDDINEAAVIGVPDTEKGNKIKAVLVRKNDSSITQQTIIQHCRANLPYYMIPDIIEFRTEIPRTATFKINRSQLS